MPKTKYLGFPLTPELENKTNTLMHNMRNTEDKTKYVNDLYSVIQDLSNVGLDYYFIQPLKTAKIGMLKMKSVEIALSAGKSGIFTVAKGILKSMDNKQLEIVMQLFEKSLTVHPDDKD
jgi:hypothetical protein